MIHNVLFYRKFLVGAKEEASISCNKAVSFYLFITLEYLVLINYSLVLLIINSILIKMYKEI